MSNEDIKKLREDLRIVRENLLPGIAARIEDLEKRIGYIEVKPPIGVPSPEDLRPTEASDFLQSFSGALASAQARIFELPLPARFAIGAVKTEVKAHLEFDEQGNLNIHLPRPDLNLQEGTLSSLEFSLVPLGAIEEDEEIAEVLVPTLVGQPLELASRQLAAIGLKVGKLEDQVYDGPSDRVLNQSPSGNTTLLMGAKVDLVVSKSAYIRVPNLVGILLDDAAKVLRKTGLRRRSTREFIPDVDEGTVVAQDPPANTLVERETQVFLTVAAAPSAA